jgi:hypothetical protein
MLDIQDGAGNEIWILVMQKEQVQGMWERFLTAKSNAAAESRFH